MTLLDGKAVNGEGTYSRRQVSRDGNERAIDEHFYRYEPGSLPMAKPNCHGATAKVKTEMRQIRIRLKEKELKKKKLQAEAAEVIASFVEDPAEGEDEESKQFWNELARVEAPHTGSRDIFKAVTSCPKEYGPRGTSQTQSRSMRLQMSGCQESRELHVGPTPERPEAASKCT